MKTQDVERFYSALEALATMFSDEMTKERRELYWMALREDISIQEWEYACTQAIKRETFHNVPLPARLMEYAREYRTEQRRVWAARQRESQQYLPAGAERSHDPNFKGTEAERRAWAVAQYATVRAQLEARWDAMDAQEGEVDGQSQPLQ